MLAIRRGMHGEPAKLLEHGLVKGPQNAYRRADPGQFSIEQHCRHLVAQEAKQASQELTFQSQIRGRVGAFPWPFQNPGKVQRKRQNRGDVAELFMGEGKPCGVPTVNQMVAEGQRCRNKCTVATAPVTSPMDAA
jgi:hypothetical protein